MNLETLLARELAGIPVERWVFALLVLVGAFLLLGAIKRLIEMRLKIVAQRTSTDLDDLLVDLIGRTRRFFLFAVAFYVAAHYVLAPYLATLGDEGAGTRSNAAVWLGYIQNAVIIAAIVQAGLWGRGLLAYGIQRVVRTRPADDPARTMGATILGFIGATFLWSFVVLLCLSNVGVDVTALITGLGVGGIAVALALQNILGDLFASITILLDKPFVVGDSIKVADFNGTIERIGVKTTRLRSVDGETIVMGNADLVASRVRNYRPMTERRAVATIGVAYSTPAARLAAIPATVRGIVESTPNARFDRCHFFRFGESSLDFELVWFATRPDYAAFVAAQQAIHLAVFESFERDGIEFAYPTRTLYLAGGPLPVVRADLDGEPARAQNELSRG